MVERQDKLPFAFLVLMAFPVLIYFYCLDRFAVNFPFLDDFNFLQGIYLFDQSDSLWESLLLLFKQHNEHRMAFSRIMFLLVDSINGEVDFRTLTLLGNLALPALLVLFYSSFRNRGINLIFFVPVPFLLFNLENWINMIWTTSALANYNVLLFAGASFYFLNKKSARSFAWAMVLAWAAGFTHGHGMGVFPVGLAYLLWQKRFRESAVWLGSATLVTFLYFYDYTLSLGIGKSLAEPGRIPIYFLIFLGSIFSFNHLIAALVVGTAVFLYFLYLTKSRYYAINGPLYCFMAFIILAGLMAALTRSGLGIHQALADRYKIQSTLMAIMVLMSAVEWYSMKKNPGPVLATGLVLGSVVFFGLACVQNYPQLAQSKGFLISSVNQWFVKNFGLFYPDPREGHEILIRGVVAGNYKFPAEHLNFPISPRSSAAALEYRNCLTASKGDFDADFNILTGKMKSGATWIRIEGMMYRISKDESRESSTAIVLKSESDTLIFPTHPNKFPTISVHFKENSDNLDFLSLISSEVLNEGNYKVGLCREGKVVFFPKYISQDKS
ncbi:MAG TPA: hypothetical protein EYO37_07245 [Nitrospina sp.]|nr:hypothetical protein [Nitrospina sp.]